MQTKTCTKCGEEKVLEEFHKEKRCKDGRRTDCKVCRKANSKKYYKKNRDKILEQSKEYYQANKDKISEYDKRRYEENREYFAEYNKKYYERNRDKLIAYQTEYSKNRRASDAMYKLRCGLRTQVRNALRKGGWSKDTKTQEILGCDFEFFYEWIENQFEEGMTWENHGEWHLDHIKPLAMASTEQEIMEFCHYSNYQPLWAFDNLSKGSLFEGERHTRKNNEQETD